MPFAIVKVFTATQSTYPTNVVDELTVFEVKSLASGNPISTGITLGKDGAIFCAFKASE
jgi:hypothetical protein